MTPRFHQARWNEPLVNELGSPGERGLMVPASDERCALAGRSALAGLPSALLRHDPPALPEVGQAQVYRHFLRLSQETMGQAVGSDIGQGTATIKYNPPVNERILRDARLDDLHPLVDDAAVQGLLEVVALTEACLRAISGLDRFSFLPGGGTHGIYANARIIRAYHESRGEGDQRHEILTTLFSHPSDAAAPATAGFRIVTIHPGPGGHATAEAVRAAVSERTAGLMLANPEDTGIFNPEIEAITRVVHDAGGLCAYDQANANGILGVVRASDCGFDLCQFNLHKTFGSPHAAGGMACGAIGARADLARFLPGALVERDGDGRWRLEGERADAIPRIRAYHGVVAAVVRAYAWLLALGPDGLRRAAETAVLNNNYLAARLTSIPGVAVSYAATNPAPRLEQIRYTVAELAERLGVDTESIAQRTGDHGVSVYFPGHHPRVIAEPATLEPTESVSRADLDRYVEIVADVAAEAEVDPELVRTAPHRTAGPLIDGGWLDDPASWALTYRAYRRKHGRRPVAAEVDGYGG